MRRLPPSPNPYKGRHALEGTPDYRTKAAAFKRKDRHAALKKHPLSLTDPFFTNPAHQDQLAPWLTTIPAMVPIPLFLDYRFIPPLEDLREPNRVFSFVRWRTLKHHPAVKDPDPSNPHHWYSELSSKALPERMRPKRPIVYRVLHSELLDGALEEYFEPLPERMARMQEQHGTMTPIPGASNYATTPDGTVWRIRPKTNGSEFFYAKKTPGPQCGLRSSLRCRIPLPISPIVVTHPDRPDYRYVRLVDDNNKTACIPSTQVLALAQNSK